VIVPMVGSGGAHCVRALASDDVTRLEILVVDRSGVVTSELERLPSVRIISVDPTTSLPAMRARGLAEAAGERVAVLGEHLRPSHTWLDAILQSDGQGARVSGGPIEAGRLGTAAEWAFFLLEYARFIPPHDSGIAGTNCVYPRVLLQGLDVLQQREIWDAELHQRAHRAGAQLHTEPALLARCEKRLGASRLIAQRYHCSRVSAARRGARWSAVRRWMFAASTPLLPPLLLARVLRVLLVKRRHRLRFLHALPLLVVATVAGAWGEARGALSGPGRSAERAE
jgi:hypothetical protein